MLFFPFPCKNHQAKYTFLPPAAPSILFPKIKQFKKKRVPRMETPTEIQTLYAG